jgi:hypothetical protein
MGEMTRTELEMAAGRQRLQELQNQHQAEQILGAKMLLDRSSPPAEQFEIVDLPAIPSRKKKKPEKLDELPGVDELLASLRPRDEDEDKD